MIIKGHKRIQVSLWRLMQNRQSYIFLRHMGFGLYRLRRSWLILNSCRLFRGLMSRSLVVWIRPLGVQGLILWAWKKWVRCSSFHNFHQINVPHLHKSLNLMTSTFSHKMSPFSLHICSFWTFIKESMYTRYQPILEQNNYSKLV